MLARAAMLMTAAALAAGCASTPSQPCAANERRSVHDMLYFGTAMPQGAVSKKDWADFVDHTVTPRFPQGLSVWNASGQWGAAQGGIVRETSYVLSLVHPDEAAQDRLVQEIVAVYRVRFRQEAVLRVRAPACVSL